MGIASILTGGIVKTAAGALDELITSDEERGAIEIKKLELELKPLLKEMDERIAQAQHPSIFVAGGRPFVIWVAGVAIGFNAIGVGVMNWAGSMWGGPDFIPLTEIEWENMMMLVGLAGGASWVRHMDKAKGVARSSLKG